MGIPRCLAVRGCRLFRAASAATSMSFSSSGSRPGSARSSWRWYASSKRPSASGRRRVAGARSERMIRLAVRCGPEQAETVLASLLELAPNGVEEERGPGWVEFAIYGAPGEVPELGELEAAAGDSLVEVTTTSVPDDWADRWADFHRPVVVGGRIGIRPSWWDAEDDLIDI